jgi:hypothetical protein
MDEEKLAPLLMHERLAVGTRADGKAVESG